MNAETHVVWRRETAPRDSASRLRSGALRDLLRGLGVAPRVAHDAAGRPLCVADSRLAISATARGPWAAAAGAWRRAVGVDVEEIGEVPEWRGIAEKLFSPDERAVLARSQPSARPELFARMWASMEACAKAAGTGIQLWREGRDDRYTVFALEAPRGYVAALALDDPDMRAA